MIVWGSPVWLWGLWALPALAVFAIVQLLKLRRDQRLFASAFLWRRMRLRPDLAVRALKQLLMLAALALLLVALADPREPGQAAGPPPQGQLMVVLDTSKSMLANDALGPDGQAVSRFEAATALVREALPLLAGWNAGLTVFAGAPRVLCPMTDDIPAVLTLLERARPGDPTLRQGTNLQAALEASRALFGNRPGTILLLSDGEELSGRALDVTGPLKTGRVTIDAVGFGSKRGTTLLNPDGSPLLWDGSPVVSARQDALLADLARSTGGLYFPSRSAVSVGGQAVAAPPGALDVVTGLKPPAAAPRPSGRSGRRKPLGAALLLLVLDAALGLGPWPRTTDRQTAMRPGPSLAAMSGLLLPFTVAVAGTAAVTLCSGWTWSSWSLTRQAIAVTQTGNPARGISLLEIAERSEPTNPAIRYDLANALCAAQHHALAVTQYRAALGRLPRTGTLTEHAWYNLGNALFLEGKPGEAARCYRKALAIAPHDADAAHNLALCRSPAQPKPSPPHRKPTPPTAGPPPPADADRLLAALENDERTRQAVAARQASQPPQPDDPSQIARDLLAQTVRAMGIPGPKDW